MSDEDWEYDLGRLLESFERHGLVARLVEPNVPVEDWKATTAKRYERTVQASRRRALDAVIGAVEALGYKDRQVFPEAAQVAFRATGRLVNAKVVDSGPGRSTVVVEFPTLKTGVMAASALGLAYLTAGLSLAAWPALRAWERRFAKGFLDNVQGVLEGRGVGEDSAVPRGLSDWRNRSREL
jgi:hypothetical protein